MRSSGVEYVVFVGPTGRKIPGRFHLASSKTSESSSLISTVSTILLSPQWSVIHAEWSSPSVSRYGVCYLFIFGRHIIFKCSRMVPSPSVCLVLITPSWPLHLCVQEAQLTAVTATFATKDDRHLLLLRLQSPKQRIHLWKFALSAREKLPLELAMCALGGSATTTSWSCSGLCLTEVEDRSSQRHSKVNIQYFNSTPPPPTPTPTAPPPTPTPPHVYHQQHFQPHHNVSANIYFWIQI